MPSWWWIAPLCILTLSGCIDTPATPASPDVVPATETDAVMHVPARDSASPLPVLDPHTGDRNHPPVAMVSVEFDASSFPFTVHYTVDAYDRDGDEIGWGLDADFDGRYEHGDLHERLPFSGATVVETPGRYVLSFAVTDGVDYMFRNTTIHAPDVEEERVHQVFDAAWDLGLYGCTPGGGLPEFMAGTNGAATDVLTGTQGKPFRIEVDHGQGIGDWQYYFLNAEDDIVGSGREGLRTDERTYTGEVPGDAARIEFYSCGAAQYWSLRYEAGDGL